MMTPKLYVAIGVVATLVVLGALGISWLGQPYQYQGSRIDPALPAVTAQLVDQQGQVFSMADFGPRKAALVFFGYTHCPDVCPTTLVEYRRIKTGLGAQAADVAFVFVTVDPERDTPAYLNTYLSAFDSDFIGLSGTEEQLEPVWRHFGVFRAKTETGSAAGYLMDHSSRTYLLDGQGNLHLTYTYGTAVDVIVADLQHFLRGR